MNKKKKKNNLFIIIVMLILLIISSYIIYDKFLQSPKDTNIINQKSKENSNQNQQNSIRKLRKEEQDILLDQIKKYNLSFASSYPFTDSKLLKNQTTLMFALKMTTKTGQDLMESDIEKELQKYFGINHPYVHEDIECPLGDGPLYKYNRAKSMYLYQYVHAHGELGFYPSELYFVSGTVENNKKIKMKVKILYADYCSGTCGPIQGYYPSISEAENKNEYILEPYTDFHNLTEEQYQTIQEKVPNTTFNFEKDKEGNYGLKSVTID